MKLKVDIRQIDNAFIVEHWKDVENYKPGNTFKMSFPDYKTALKYLESLK